MFPFWICFISGSRVPVVFFVEPGGLMMVASMIVPGFISSPCAFSRPRTKARMCSGS